MHLMKYLQLASCIGVVALATARAENYQKVDPVALKANPQVYWARGIVFSDVLAAKPGEKEVKLGGRSVHAMETKDLGACYVDAALLPVMTKLEVGHAFIFSGTVYQEPRGLLWPRKRPFHVLINRVAAQVKDSGELLDGLRDALARSDSDNPYAIPFQTLDSILADAQRELETYCAASNLDLRAVFEMDSPHADQAVRSIRQALYRQEMQSKTPALEYFVNLLTSLLAAQHGGLDVRLDPALVAPPETPATAPAPTPEPPPPPAPVAVPEAPLKPEAEPTPKTSLKPAAESAPLVEAPAVSVPEPEQKPETSTKVAPEDPAPAPPPVDVVSPEAKTETIPAIIEEAPKPEAVAGTPTPANAAGQQPGTAPSAAEPEPLIDLPREEPPAAPEANVATNAEPAAASAPVVSPETKPAPEVQAEPEPAKKSKGKKKDAAPPSETNEPVPLR